MILSLYTASLIAWAWCDGDVKEYGAHPNVTILYPVKNISFLTKDEYNSNKIKDYQDLTNKSVIHNEQKSKTKSNKKENSAEGNEESSKEFDKDIPGYMRKDEDDMIATRNEDIKLKNSSNNANNNIHPKEHKIYGTNWKIDTGFTLPKYDKEDIFYNDTNKPINNNPHPTGKEFKASPQLDNFYDEDTFVTPHTHAPKETSLQFADPYFKSVSQDFHKLKYKPPSFNYQEQTVEPYKFENSLFSGTKDWNYSFGIESTPTVETPAKIPAGGLYNDPDAFKEKPGFNGVDENFGLEVKDEGRDSNENPLKKRNPWKSFLHLVTALVPVGIIISALTPNIITLESTDNNPHFPSRFSRRSTNVADLPSISESCKRRLLCEIHSDANYLRDASLPRRRKHCYKLSCEDPQALYKILHWLLLFHRSRDYRPSTPHDRRGYIT